MDRHQSTFRVNFQVVQMLGVVLVALAVPVALVVFGIRQYSSKSSASAPEAPGLRVALEQAAEKSWQTPEPMSDARSVFILPASASVTEARKAIEQAARKFNGGVIPISAGQRGEERLLVQIPVSTADLFESASLRGFSESQHGHPTGGSRLYELVFPAP